MKRQVHPLVARPVNAVVAGSIHRFSSTRRNAVRGAVADARRGTLASNEVDSIRANQTEADMLAAATMLEAEGGLRERKVCGLLQSDLAPVHPLRAHSGQLEAAYIRIYRSSATRTMSFVTVVVRRKRSRCDRRWKRDLGRAC